MLKSEVQTIGERLLNTAKTNGIARSLGFKNYNELISVLTVLNIKVSVEIYKVNLSNGEAFEAVTIAQQGDNPNIKKLIENLGYNSLHDLVETFNVVFTEYYVGYAEIQIPLTQV